MWKKTNKSKTKTDTHRGHHLYGTGPLHLREHVRNWKLITTASAKTNHTAQKKQNKTKTKQKNSWGVEKSFDMSDCIILLRAPKHTR